MMVKLLATLGLAASVALGLDLRGRDAILRSVPATNEKSSLTLLYQNSLNSTEDENHVGVILLGALSQHDVRDACEETGESMVSFATIEKHVHEFMSYFSYMVFSGIAEPGQQYYTRDGVLAVSPGMNDLSLWQFGDSDGELPVLCTHNSTGHTGYNPERNSRDAVRVASGGNLYVGLRDRKSFRFLGIPYANPPQRFTYSELYSKRSQTIKATEYGPTCAQVGRGSEDCLFLNIQTPYIPKRGSTNGLKPVLFWIHGGGFLEGSGSDPLTDGGNLASREDIVVVSFNYRLSTLGFLAVPGSDIRGNYGIADQTVALEWTIKNIAQFGGDPQHITIVGEYTDTGSARVLLESPSAVGKFHGAIAIPEIGGRVGLGHESDNDVTYGHFLKPEESFRLAGQQIVSAVGCTGEILAEQISCLRRVPASTLVGLDTVARYAVQDGHYVNTSDPNAVEKDHVSADVPIMFVVTADDASFSGPSSVTQHGLKIPEPDPNAEEENVQGTLDHKPPSYNKDKGIASRSPATFKQDTAVFGIQCVDQTATFADMFSRATSPSYFCHMGKSSAESGPAGLEVSSAMVEFLRGAPILPYFRLHRGDQQLPLIFGNLSPQRQVRDLHSAHLASAYFGEFVRSGRPNPSAEFLKARGYLIAH